MNFDTYKINEELIEIYRDNEETFSVGIILSNNESSVFFRSYDEQGKNDGLHFVKSNYISKVKSNTQYLRKIQLYLEYWKTMKDGVLLNPFKKHPSLFDLFLYAKRNHKIVTVSCSAELHELITGYIERYDGDNIKLSCVDMETACIYDHVILSESDIFYLEIESLDNELLKYANENIDIK